MPASFFYEFTGKKSPKSKWRFTKSSEDWFCFAGLWRPTPERGAAFTLLTTDPSADVAPIHDRQMVILERSDWSAWLQGTGNEADLLRALPAGSLKVEQVRRRPKPIDLASSDPETMRVALLTNRPQNVITPEMY